MVEYDSFIPDNIYRRFFPRNLSYTEEGYLDNWSESWKFVKAPSSPRRGSGVNGLFESLLCERYARLMMESESSWEDKETDSNVKVAIGKNPMADSVDKGICNATSEEGVFVNMMDDLDIAVESPQSRGSDGSSDVCYFSLESTSPEEDDDTGSVKQLTAVCNELNTRVHKKGQQTVKKSASDGQIEDKREEKSLGEIPQRLSDENVRKFADFKIQISGGDFTDQAKRYLLHDHGDSPTYEEPEFQFNKGELRKSSSLKSTKTPPGTPSRKKMVRFADAMGLDLEDIRHVLNTEHPPKIPASAIADLKVGVEAERSDIGSRYLDLLFPQPGAMEGFSARVMANKVALENCIITDLNITGIVRVANIGFHKCVRVRYTINNWVTFYDIMASYVQNSCDGPTDRFSFTVVAPAGVGPGSRIAFAVSFTVNDTIYWDSNDGKNYEIVCYAKTTPTDLEPGWLHFV